MKTIRIIPLVILPICLAACAGMFEEDDIALSEVPSAAIKAAEGAVDGFVVKSAETKDKDGRTVYEIDGKAGDVKHEVIVTASGEVLKVKTE